MIIKLIIAMWLVCFFALAYWAMTTTRPL
jgi:hypothetical protein